MSDNPICLQGSIVFAISHSHQDANDKEEPHLVINISNGHKVSASQRGATLFVCTRSAGSLDISISGFHSPGYAIILFSSNLLSTTTELTINSSELTVGYASKIRH
ncbi:predicted protein [Botrytis cinerea T4]|uniref:Uncharacterized protein n=1 Tax=Botryotinia fuckeliana (strain T4) TaxID=999810 RepID=G2YPV6_BOTF4|nr:predicted protein [Botrytis cinerea T4]